MLFIALKTHTQKIKTISPLNPIHLLLSIASSSPSIPNYRAAAAEGGITPSNSGVLQIRPIEFI